MFGFKTLYVVTFDNRTDFIIEAKSKKEAMKKAMVVKDYKRVNAHWYTANEITGVRTFFMDYFFPSKKKIRYPH